MKRLYIFFSVIIVLFVIFFGCQQTGGSGGGGGGGGFDETPATVYAIGDTGPSGVGKVFYITDGGLHGLEAAPSLWNGGAADPTSTWITGGATRTTLNGNTLTGIGTGLANSNAIIAQLGHTASAAKLCRDYTGGGKTDWFLPSKDELAQLYAERAAVGGLSVLYWSSSEANADNAWGQYFNSGTQPNLSKSAMPYVRAVRSF